MKALVVLAHPNRESFNAAIKAAVLEELNDRGDDVRTHDLYAMRFNPVLNGDDFATLRRGEVESDIRPLQSDVRWADLLIFIYPTWWVNVPAILKGYFDRVLSHGFAFQTSAGGSRGLLHGKVAFLIQTMGSSPEVAEKYRMMEAIRSSVDVGTLGFCGIQVLRHEFFTSVPFVSDGERGEMLSRVRDMFHTEAARRR